MAMRGLLYILLFDNGKSYVGITSGTANRRLSLHLYHAKKGRPGALQSAIRKYGQTGFIMRTLAVCKNWDYLCDLEKKAIFAFGTIVPNGYNLTAGGEGTFGVMRSLEFREKQSMRMKGKFHGTRFSWGSKHTADAREKIAAAGRGRVFSDSRRDKMGKSKIGNQYCVGRRCSDETKKKISEAQKGRKISEEHRLKLVGREISEETRIKMSVAAKGKPWSSARRLAHEARAARK